MSKNKMMVIAEKESFIARVLINKVNSSGQECSFVPWTIDDISSNIDSVQLVVMYMDNGVRPEENLLHFLIEQLEEKSMQIILVGEQVDIQYVCANMPGELIYASFPRPVDNTKFTDTVAKYFELDGIGAFKKRILVVDDDPQYLTLVREWLKESYKVSMVNSGLQAIKWLGKNKVDLILLDYEMPVTSGPQVLEMLRSDTDTASIPVIFLTGKGDKESVMAVLTLRPDGYFLKNIQKDELLEKLQEYFVLHR